MIGTSNQDAEITAGSPQQPKVWSKLRAEEGEVRKQQMDKDDQEGDIA